MRWRSPAIRWSISSWTWVTLPPPPRAGGNISAKRVRAEGYARIEEIQTDAAINPGNSGGPVYLLRDGSVIGLASKRLTRESNIGFAATVNALKRLAGR